MATKFDDKYQEKIQQNLDDSGIVSNIDNSNPYGLQIQNAIESQYQAPTYENKYGSKLDSLYDAMQNRQAFSYNENNDPVYQAYRKQYLREGQRATKNTMATAAAATGGQPSSYAVSAAAQAGNYYASQLSDKIPELYQQAYNRYLQEFQDQALMAQTLQTAQQQEYNRYSQDRQFDYGVIQDRIGNMMDARRQELDIAKYNQDFNYQQKQDRLQNMQTQQQHDWNRYVQERNWENQAEQNAWSEALNAYELGDARKLEALGVDTSKDINRQVQELQLKSQQWQTQLQQAQTAASYGDYSQLKAMGFDTSKANFDRDLTVAQIWAQYTGDTSYLAALLNGNSANVGGATATKAATSSSSGGSRSSSSVSGNSSKSSSSNTSSQKDIATIRASKSGYGTTDYNASGAGAVRANSSNNSNNKNNGGSLVGKYS